MVKVVKLIKTWHIIKDLEFLAKKTNEVIDQGNENTDRIELLEKELVELKKRLGIEKKV